VDLLDFDLVRVLDLLLVRLCAVDLVLRFRAINPLTARS
jgi:hypothetical protein